MRILIATHHLDIIGGLETHLRSVLPLLRGAGHSLRVVAEDPPTDRKGILDDCPEIEVIRAPAGAEARVLRAVADWSPDVIYQHGLGSAELEASLADRYPSVLYAHGYFGTCVSGSKCHSWPSQKVCERALGPACLGIFPVLRCGGRNPVTMLRMYGDQRSHQRALTKQRKVLVASRHMAAEYRRNGVAEDRLQILPHYPPDVVPDAEPPALRSPTNRVLFTGRIMRLKGLHVLIDALPIAQEALGRELTLVVAGDGPERAAAERQAARGKARVEFLGWLSSERRNEEMRAADVLAIPSLWPEPFGLVGIEAGCVGTPGVGYAVGGIPDWLIPGRSGELAPADALDAPSLAAALARALKDGAHWSALRRGAWDVAKEFSRERHVRALLSVLEGVAAPIASSLPGGAHDVSHA